ncbi:methylated-DNA--[protein]-cysteine S-methyltransferase [Lutimonas sp.]|uniref:methylated-DNA--[protein]-cysteine S-methyltransferase n=1 Tax=Lutimonas sp. TaxID=1872403 RepID=UPI003D9BB948
MDHLEYCFLKTPIGTAKIIGNDKGISEITVLDKDVQGTEVVPESLRNCFNQLSEYFNGDRQIFSLKLNPKGTDFQKKVWDELLLIPFGKRTTYMKQTLKLGNEKAIRAVASANGKNPLWIVVPCHRVVGTDGSLTGYAGGIWRKKWLLEHESPSGQTSLF